MAAVICWNWANNCSIRKGRPQQSVSIPTAHSMRSATCPQHPHRAHIAHANIAVSCTSANSLDSATTLQTCNTLSTETGVGVPVSSEAPRDPASVTRTNSEDAVWTVHAATGWTAKQQHHVLTHGRNWKAVERLWEQVVCGQLSLADLQPPVAPAEQYLPDMQTYLGPSLTVQAEECIAVQAEGTVTVQAEEGVSVMTVPGCQSNEQASSIPNDAAESDSVASAARKRPSNKKKSERCTYKVAVAYYGPAFVGWAYNPALPDQLSVEGALCRALQPLVAPASKANVSGAGRTDKNVSAAGQVFSFYSWHQLSQEQIAAAIHSAPQVQLGTLRVLASCQQPRSFHANFSATWRRYVYIMPLRNTSGLNNAFQDTQPYHTGSTHMQISMPDSMGPQAGMHDSAAANLQQAEDCLKDSLAADLVRAEDLLMDTALDTHDVDPHVVHELLQPLVGKPLDFYAFARDTPKGKDTVCQLLLARATRVLLPSSCSQPGDHVQEQHALCIELVADRFLRRMVRVLVSTVVVEALAVQAAQAKGQPSAPVSCSGPAATSKPHVPLATVGNGGELGWPAEHHQAMLQYCHEGVSRTATCIPAPAEGLCFAGVGYGDVLPV